jgi:hypothetical protein
MTLKQASLWSATGPGTLLLRYGESRFPLIVASKLSGQPPPAVAAGVQAAGGQVESTNSSPPERWGWRKFLPIGNLGPEMCFVIPKDLFVGTLCQGFDHQSVIAGLQERQLLRAGPQNRAIHQERIPEIGRVSVVVVRSKVVDTI